jgi:hypothetical protein
MKLIVYKYERNYAKYIDLVWSLKQGI